MIKAPPTPKGFRDIAPKLAIKRREIIGQIVEVLKNLGFVPIETPTIEFAETLTGKYGDEEKLIYKFTDRGGRDLALRYDLTVPLARFVASNLNLISKEPFRRYQIGQVFRGENPQHGRYREFTQFDFDSVGSTNTAEEDALIIETAIKATRKLGLQNFQLKINSKDTLNSMQKLYDMPASNSTLVFREMDKVGKVTQKEIDQAIVSVGNFSRAPYVSAATISGTISPAEYSHPKTPETLFGTFKDFQPQAGVPSPTMEEITVELQQESLPQRMDSITNTFNGETAHYKEIRKILINKGIKESEIQYERRLVRGIDYYTGVYFELKPNGKLEDLTIGSGGRYDDLIGMFAKKPIPAVGFSFGLERLIDLLE